MSVLWFWYIFCISGVEFVNIRLYRKIGYPMGQNFLCFTTFIKGAFEKKGKRASFKKDQQLFSSKTSENCEKNFESSTSSLLRGYSKKYKICTILWAQIYDNVSKSKSLLKKKRGQNLNFCKKSAPTYPLTYVVNYCI